ncbi:MAG: tyrosine recombinase [Pseudomonadota bacterium]
MSDANRINAFLEMMSAERGAALNTLDAYRRDLDDASAFLGSGLCEAGPQDITRFLRSLSQDGLAASTSARKLSALRRFYRFLFEEGERADNPTSLIDTPQSRRTVPDVLSRDELTHLIDAGGEDVRLTCLVELLYGAGLRASELCALPLGALPRRKAGQWETRALTVRGKGGADRVCPLGGPALEAISDWLCVREDHLPKGEPAKTRASSFLFPSRGKSGHLTRRRLGQMLDDLAVKAGISPSKVHPHALRHAYATHLLQGGADLRSVQTLLGHADIATTQIYTHVMTDELAELLDVAHPLAQQGGLATLEETG